MNKTMPPTAGARGFGRSALFLLAILPVATAAWILLDQPPPQNAVLRGLASLQSRRDSR